MSLNQKIPIKNIYYMLCYASGILPHHGDTICGSETFDHIYNLMARVLILSVSQLLRCGFHREYIAFQEPLSSLRGRIDLQQSIRQQTMIRKQLVCHYDELSADVAFNQIIKATITILIRCPYLNRKYRTKLEKLRKSFSHISDIRPTAQTFSSLRFTRNNRYYLLTMNICRLLFEHLITNEADGKIHFADFIQDEKMATLYEKFVLNFFILHLPRKEFHVLSSRIKWILEDNIDVPIPYLPEMRTDIVLTNKQSNTQLIIDTKFYTETLTYGYFSKKKIIHQDNLYQMYAYLSNTQFPGKTAGLLLYPTVSEELDVHIPIKEKPIWVKTLNLNKDWESIENQLITIARFTESPLSFQ